MNDPVQNEWHRLFSAALNGTITEAEKTELAIVLKSSAEARQLWFLYQDNECGLGELKQRSAARLAPPITVAPRRVAAFQWRPLTAAVAGLALGLFSATMVLGFVGPRASRAMTLLQESFESGPPPLVTGVPVEAGRWSGDYSEVVGEFQGVRPASGKKMLRFLRADYEGKPGRDGYVADLFRIIDLRDSKLDVASGDACVSFEARFSSITQNGPQCGLSVYALDALPAANERHEFLLKLREEQSSTAGATEGPGATILATASRQGTHASPGDSWLIARSELRLPSGTRFLMVHAHEWIKGQQTPQPVEFAGLFLDDIRVTLTHRPELP